MFVLLSFLLVSGLLSKTNAHSFERCLYWKLRYPTYINYICDLNTDPWYGMWPYERKILNGGSANAKGNETTDEYGEKVPVVSSSGCSVLNQRLYCSSKTKL